MEQEKKKKRDYTKFFTYPETAAFMVELLEAKDGDFIIEPSAGSGNLVRALRAKHGKEIYIHGVEINEKHRGELSEVCDAVFMDDFLNYQKFGEYDRCIANPPFGNGTDLRAHFDHIREMVKLGGKIVMIVPEDFSPRTTHNRYKLEHWSKNSDGTTTEIKIIVFENY